MYRCEVCNKNFNSQHDRDGHLGSAKHARKQAHQHQHAGPIVHNGTQFHCCDCDRDFVDEVALLQHLRDKIHKLKPRSATSKNFACDLCGKAFATKRAVKSHKASPVHKPLCKRLPCLGSQKCSKTFISPSSMLHHLESGACISGLTRHRINGIIISQDTDRLISSQQAIEALESSDDSLVILTPSSSRCSALDDVDSWSFTSTGSGMSLAEIDTPEASTLASMTGMHDEKATHKATRKVWLCPLCPPNSNRFKTAQDLEKHSMSAAHAPKLFHCPTALLVSKKRTHVKTFSTLSGVAMHVESGACLGGKKVIKNVLRFVNDRLNELGLHQISLLE